jgi:hypothetical protein
VSDVKTAQLIHDVPAVVFRDCYLEEGHVLWSINIEVFGISFADMSIESWELK